MRSKNRYAPHQSLRERSRRLRQIGDARLSGAAVTEEARTSANVARLLAIGLVPAVTRVDDVAQALLDVEQER